MSEGEEAVKPILGVWKCDNKRTEKFEELLTALGVNFMMRKMAVKGAPKMTFTLNDGKFTIKNEGAMSTKVTSFPLDGTPVEVENFGGQKSDSNFAVVDGKPAIVSVPKDASLKKVVVTREVVDGDLVQLVNYNSDEIIAKRVFVKQP